MKPKITHLILSAALCSCAAATPPRVSASPAMPILSPTPRHAPVAFHVDAFTVPVSARSEFEAAMRRNLVFIQTLPGFLGHWTLEKSGGASAFNMITVASWEDDNALGQAKQEVQAYYQRIGVDMPSLMAKWGVRLERGDYDLSPAFPLPFASAPEGESNKQTIRRLFTAGVNHGDAAVYREIVDSAFAVEGIAASGPDAYSTLFVEPRTGFPDIRFSIEDLISEGDRVVVRWRWEGTHTGTFHNVAPTGKGVTNTGVDVYRFKNNKIVQLWFLTDRLGVLRQIGAR